MLVWLIIVNLVFIADARSSSVWRTVSQKPRLCMMMSDAPSSGGSGELAKLGPKTSELSDMLEQMPTADKYALLIQSYAGKILDSSNRNATAMSAIESLYIEMLASGNKPTEKTSQTLIDAASSFCNSAKLGRALQLAKASGTFKAFGAANGQLTTPIVAANIAAQLFSPSTKMTTDDRESEIFSTSVVSVGAFLFVALQVVGWIDTDVHPYATLWGCALAIAGGYDIFLAQGKFLKRAAAGLERLSLRDPQREAYTEASAFLAGYLLGLPCFCFQPDVSEALKLLRNCPGSLDAYKQPVAMVARGPSKTGGGGGGGGGGVLADLFSWTPTRASTAKKPATPSTSTAIALPAPSASPGSPGSDADSKTEANLKLLRAFLDVDTNAKADLLGLSRLLIWLVTPVAAETMKYGSSVMSDPRRGRRMLAILESLQYAVKNSKADAASAATSDVPAASSNSTSSAPSAAASEDEGLSGISVPSSAEDKEALVQWAYNEATLLVRQYGDLLEGVSEYIQSGTASVGECALLIEQELR